MAESTLPKVFLSVGTHLWAPTPESEVFQDEILEIIRAHRINRLDTARSYGMGASETAIGNRGLSAEFSITTKAATGLGNGAGKRENILTGAAKSLGALKVNKVPIYLLHAPDDTVPVEETYSAIQTLYEEGHFDKFGLSNFNRDQVLEYYNYGKSHNLVLPTVFQASYSPAVRLNEALLFPTLRELGISIQAYSPMAGGFLSRTSSELTSPTPGGKWAPDNILGKFYRSMFFKPSYVTFLGEWEKLVEESGVSRIGLAYRWVAYHSMLKGELGDEMIIGASSAKQLEESVTEIEKGPLERWVVDKIERLWEGIKNDAEVDNLRAIREVFGGVN